MSETLGEPLLSQFEVGDREFSDDAARQDCREAVEELREAMRESGASYVHGRMLSLPSADAVLVIARSLRSLSDTMDAPTMMMIWNG